MRYGADFPTVPSSLTPPPAPTSLVQPAHLYLDPIPGIIPFGTVTLFAGAPGVGKTAMLAEWCRRWRDGLTICEKPTNRPTGFYYLAADRQWQSHQLWFDAVGFPNILHYSVADDPTLDLNTLAKSYEAHKCFKAAVDKLNPIPGSHLFVDPASPLFIGGDPNRARDVAAALLRFSRLCQERQINLTITAHFGKQKSDPREQYTRPQDRIAGSGAFSGFSDTQVYLIDPVLPDQPYHILGWVPRHARPEEFHFVREKSSGLFVPYTAFTEQDYEQQILACIPYDATPSHEIVDLIHATMSEKLPLRTIERYLSRLKKAGLIQRVQRGVYKRAKPS